MELEVRGQELVVLSCGELVSGTVGVYRAEFSFAPEWAGLAATAVFRSEPYSGGESVERKAVLGADGACAVPWEVLAQGGGFLKVGVYGVDAAGTVIVPTLWCRAGYIAKGTPTDASPGQDPTPTVAEQMTAEFAAARAEVVAEADRAEAAARQAEADAAETARLAMEVADHAAQAAEDRAATAADRTAATIARTYAEAAQAAAEAAQSMAETAQRAAETAKAGAETSAGSAASAAQTATGKAAEAVQSAKDAADALTEGRRVLAQVVEAGSTALAAIGAAGTGQVKAVTDEGAKQAKAVQDKGTEQAAAVRTEGEAQTASAKAEADRAQAERERIEGLDVYTRTETDILLAGKADQPYKEFITPASVEDSAGGRVVVDRLDGQTVQRAYVHTVGESGQAGTKGINVFNANFDPSVFVGTGYRKYLLPLKENTVYSWRLDNNKFVGSNCYAIFCSNINYSGSSDSIMGAVGGWIGHSSNPANTKKFDTFRTDSSPVYLALYTEAGTPYPTAVALLKELMLVEGSYTAATMPPYEPYSGGLPSPRPDWTQPITPSITGGKYQTRTHRGLYELTLPDLYSLGDARAKVVIDPVTGTGKWVDVCQLKVLDGTEPWARSENSGNEVLYIILSDGLTVGYGKGGFLCTHDQVKAIGWTLPGARGFVVNASKEGFQPSWVFAAGAHTVATWKAEVAARFSSETPMTLLYRLATPIITPITLTPVTSSTASVLPVEWVDYAPTPEVPVTMESVEKGKLWSVGRNLVIPVADSSFPMGKEGITVTKSGPSYTVSGTTTLYPFFVVGKIAWQSLGDRNTFSFTRSGVGANPRLIQRFSDGTYNVITILAGAFAKPIAQDDILFELATSPGTTNATFSNFQVERGAIATAYTPYTGQAYDIPLAQALSRVNGLSDVVAPAQSGRYEATNHLGIMLARNMVWSKSARYSVNGFTCFMSTRWHITVDRYTRGVPFLCSHFPIVERIADKDVQGAWWQEAAANGAVYAWLKVPDTLASTEQELMAWFERQGAQSTPVQFLYPLREPQTIDLPDSTQALLRSIVTAPGVAHLWFEGAVVPSMTAAYRLELTAWVKCVTQTQQQGATAAYLSLVADEQGGTEQDLARIMHEQHATGAELSNIETQQAITDLMIGGISHGF